MKPLINFLFGMVIIFLVAAVHEKVLPMWLALWIIPALLICLIMGNIPSSEPEETLKIKSVSPKSEEPTEEIAAAKAAGKCGQCYACVAGYHEQCHPRGGDGSHLY